MIVEVVRIQFMNKHCDPNHGNRLRTYGSSKLRIPEMIPAAVRLKDANRTWPNQNEDEMMQMYNIQTFNKLHHNARLTTL